MPYNKRSELPDAVRKMPAHAQDIWMKAFNSAINQYHDEGKAAATAWAAVKKEYKQNSDGEWVAKEAHPHGDHICYCPKCNYEMTVAEDVKCNTQSCPECGVQMRAKETGENREANVELTLEMVQTKYAELVSMAGVRAVPPDIIREASDLVTGLDDSHSANVLEAALNELAKAQKLVMAVEATKTEDGQNFPASAYAYVPDSEKPSTWKLRMWEDPTKKVTRKQLGAAAAALSPGGFRGQKVEIPSEDLPAVKRKIRSAYRSLDVPEDEMPRWVKEAGGEVRALVLEYTPMTEAKVTTKGRGELEIIRPGFNESKTRFYPAEVLARDYGIFEGNKMYCDHPTEAEDKARPERSLRDWVATLENVRPRGDGVLVGDYTVVEPWFESKLAMLRDKGQLDKIGVSINAVGAGSRQKIEGVETAYIEKLVASRSVDFVTEAGAGGSVKLFESTSVELDVDLVDEDALRERRPDIVKAIEAGVRDELIKEVKLMSEQETKIKELEGQVTTLTTERDDLKNQITEADKAKAKAEAQAAIKEAVDKAELPDAAKTRILERFKEAESTDGVEDAIKSEREYIATLTEAGKVKNLGPNPPDDPAKSKQELKEAFMRTGMSEQEAEIAANGR